MGMASEVSFEWLPKSISRVQIVLISTYKDSYTHVGGS